MAIDPLSLDFGRDKRFCVYVYFDPRPRKKFSPVYVGKGLTAKRPDLHWRVKSQNGFLNAVLTKIRQAGFAPVVEFVGFFDNETAALRLEAALIAKFGRRDKGLGTLCNLTDGGDGGQNGRIASAKTRAKMSAWQKGKKKLSDAQRAAIGARTRGKRLSESAREAISRPVVADGVRYPSLQAAGLALKVNMTTISRRIERGVAGYSTEKPKTKRIPMNEKRRAAISTREGRPVMAGGQQYPSIVAAARALDVTMATIRRRIKKDAAGYRFL